MPLRKTVFADGEFYHIFNRTINKETIFSRSSECNRFLLSLFYYQHLNLPAKLSYFLSFGFDKRLEVIKNLEEIQKRIEIICFCLMPNHYHLLLKQLAKDGISSYVRLFQNSFTRFFNTKNTRSGYLFEGQFKAVRVEDNNQLLHLNRYIHLNPYSSFVVKHLEELEDYPYSSFAKYLGKKQNNLIACHKEIVLSQFPDIKSYKRFIYDQAGYQKQLKLIRHLTFE
ncbi:MAG: hypothetical protein A2905_02040 [Candidatus Levybacteria bacterium RIFCSPLOWO2_01_FULL_36_10]|nr:MAG: hypothetical protein A2905_02040 [Candidatus Levybacteria bacterium RIFCSPLOWO2_01_FULL_36_10]